MIVCVLFGMMRVCIEIMLRWGGDGMGVIERRRRKESGIRPEHWKKMK